MALNLPRQLRIVETTYRRLKNNIVIRIQLEQKESLYILKRKSRRTISFRYNPFGSASIAQRSMYRIDYTSHRSNHLSICAPACPLPPTLEYSVSSSSLTTGLFLPYSSPNVKRFTAFCQSDRESGGASTMASIPSCAK